MKSLSKILGGLAACGAFMLSAAHAVVVIDPTTGLSGSVSYDNDTAMLGIFEPVDSIDPAGADPAVAGNTLTITVAVDSFIDFTIADGGTAGDAYALQLGGFTLAPTGGNMGADTKGAGATSFFSMFINNIFLPAGVNTFAIFVTDTNGIPINLNEFTFSAARPVPIPGAIPLFLAGLAGLAFARRSRKKA